MLDGAHDRCLAAQCPGGDQHQHQGDGNEYDSVEQYAAEGACVEYGIRSSVGDIVGRQDSDDLGQRFAAQQ